MQHVKLTAPAGCVAIAWTNDANPCLAIVCVEKLICSKVYDVLSNVMESGAIGCQ